MVQLAHDEGTLRMLVERLLWPVRMVRWRVAQQYGALLATKRTRDPALAVYLEWLTKRRLESEVVSALSILKCVPYSELPPFSEVCGAVNAPSVLADAIFQQVYGYGNRCGGWSSAHSGEAPASFEQPKYFVRNKGAHVPLILWNTLSRLHARTGIDFPKHWAFEWQSIMDRTDSPHSDYPYYFVESTYRQAGVSGQFSLRQDDVFRSAFIRTVAFGVSKGMPSRYAHGLACETLTLNSELANLNPVSRPVWLSNLPEQCCADGADLETLVRKIIVAGSSSNGRLPISLKIPISAEVEKFAELEIAAVLATADFKCSSPNLHALGRNLWVLGEPSAFSGPLPEDDITTCTFAGDVGDCVPLAMTLYADPMGFWHVDYFSVGIALPMSCILPGPATIACRPQSLDVEVGGGSVAKWTVWHDNYSPLHAPEGHPRCGMLTVLDLPLVAQAEAKLMRELGWVARLRVWKSEKDYGELVMDEKRMFFFD